MEPIDFEKLKAIKEWSEDLADELRRPTILPCKMVDRLGDCLSRQARYLLEDMKPKKMCERCKARWYAMLAAKKIAFIYDAKTNKEVQALPSF